MFAPLSRFSANSGSRRLFASAQMSSSECWSTLGLRSGSSEEQVKQAYRKLAKTHHPDLGGSTDQFVRIQRAYENLLDSGDTGNSTGSSSASSQKGSSSGSQYWRSWDTGSSWWTGGGSPKYSADQDFDAEFEEQWRRFTSEKRKEKGRRFRAKSAGTSQEAEEQRDSNSESNTFKERGRRARKSAKPTDLPGRLKLSSVDSKPPSTVCGEFVRISNFNGRACYSNSSAFLFWSSKNKDWKLAALLKDDGNCIAFNDKAHPSLDFPLVSGQPARWMVWNERSKRYLPAKLLAEFVEEDFSSWSVEELRSALLSMGLSTQADQCCEKPQLVELMTLYRHLYCGRHESRSSASDSIPEGQFRLCSRQRHDGVVQAPPVLSDRCKVGKNRVDNYTGSVEGIEQWLMKNGDRRRFYGVYDSDKNYCFGLIWKNNKSWARAGHHDW